MREVVTGSLSDMLASTYSAMLDELAKDDSRSPGEQIWHWRFYIGILGHTYLLQGINALHLLVTQYWDEYDEVWQETWQPPSPSSCEIHPQQRGGPT
jgi:hypothetical protein